MIFRLYFYLGYYVLNLLIIKDPIALIVTTPIFLLVLFNVWKMRDKYFTVSDIITLLVFLFFVIEPLQMIDHGRIGTSGPVSRVTYTNAQLIMAAAVALVFYATFLLTIKFLGRSKEKIRLFVMDKDAYLPIFLMVVISFVLFVWLNGGFSEVFASRYERLAELENQTSDNARGALIMASTGAMTMGTVILASLTRPKLDGVFFCFVLALIGCLTCLNPFNTSRFALLSAYMPIFLVFTNGKVRATIFYVASMIGVVVIFPILNITTRFGLEGLSEHSGDIATNALSIQFMDIYDLLAECVHFIDMRGFYHGQKLFADLVSFFPRAWWPEKPIIGGLDIGYEMFSNGIFGTANVSQMVAADGYMDFGLPGVVLVGIIIGVIVHLLVFRRRYLINGHNLYGYIFVAALPILLRGPLTAVYLTFLAQALVLLSIRKVLSREIPVPKGVRPAGLNATGYLFVSSKKTERRASIRRRLA